MTSIHQLHRRIDRVGDEGGRDIAAMLEASWAAQKARQAAWTAAGHAGAPPAEPIPPPPGDRATRAQRETWRKVAEGLARVAHVRDGRFVSLPAAYALADHDLAAALNRSPF